MFDTDSILQVSSPKRYAQNSIIVREGEVDENAEMFLLLRGSATAFKSYNTPSQMQVYSYNPGDFFGEMTLFLHRPRSTTIVATTEVIVLAIGQKNAFEFFKNQPSVTFMIIEGICRRLENMNEAYHKLTEEIRNGGRPTAVAPAVPSVPAASAAAAPAAATQTASQSCELFPEGHGSYILPIDNTLSNYLYEQSYRCPLCDHSFKDLSVRASQLRMDHTDDDLRIHYRDIEPLFYEIVTCPSCLYSAINDSFAGASKRRADTVKSQMAAYAGRLPLKFGYERDTFTVFAGLYLAMICAPICQSDSALVTAKLWVKLSRLYKDAEDEKMSLYASQRALDDYNLAYTTINISGRAFQQLCYVIGDLYFKLGDLTQSKNYFFRAKSDREGTNAMKQKADDRLEAIREIEKAGK